MSDEAKMMADLEAMHRRVDGALSAVVREATDRGYKAALGKHRWQNRTGATQAALKHAIHTTGDGMEGEVSVNSENAIRLNDGTPAHRITAHGRALKFEIGGKTLFRPYVNHPGTAPDPYLDNAADEVDAALDGLVEAALDQAME